MAATLTQTKPAWIDRQPRWLLASLAAAAFATVLAGCGAPTTQPPGSCIDTADHGCISAG